MLKEGYGRQKSNCIIINDKDTFFCKLTMSLRIFFLVSIKSTSVKSSVEGGVRRSINGKKVVNLRNKKEIGWVSVEEKLESFFSFPFSISAFSFIHRGWNFSIKKIADVESLLVVVCGKKDEGKIEFSFYTLILASVRANRNLFYYFKWEIIGGKTEEKEKNVICKRKNFYNIIFIFRSKSSIAIPHTYLLLLNCFSL